ncbi:MAG: hypothetical protein ACOYNI_08975 [Acidimicrobiia bacterium]
MTWVSVCIVVAVSASFLVGTNPAGADSSGLTYGGARTPTGGTVWANGTWHTPGRPGVSVCRNEIVDPSMLFQWPYEPPFEGGIYFVRVCAGVRSGWRWASAPSELATYANSRTLELPRVAPSTAPGVANEQLVGVPMWLWIDGSQWQAQRREFFFNGVQIGVVGFPVRVEWDMGDGSTVVCDGPGLPFDRARPVAVQHSDCTYTYLKSSLAGRSDQRFRVVARAVWSLQWFASEGPWQDLGEVVMEQPFSVRVVEAQALLTRSGTGVMG